MWNTAHATPGTHLVFAVTATMLIFAMDLLIPHGVVIPMLYVAPILLAMWFPIPRALGIATMTVLATILTILGMLYAPPRSIGWMIMTNRLLALLTIWMTALIALLWLLAEEDVTGLRT